MVELCSLDLSRFPVVVPKAFIGQRFFATRFNVLKKNFVPPFSFSSLGPFVLPVERSPVHLENLYRN
jgi:hypothetical protein